MRVLSSLLLNLLYHENTLLHKLCFCRQEATPTREQAETFLVGYAKVKATLTTPSVLPASYAGQGLPRLAEQ